MKRSSLNHCLLLMLAMFSMNILVGCNTVAGVGKDVEKAGEKVEEKAEDCKEDC